MINRLLPFAVFALPLAASAMPGSVAVPSKNVIDVPVSMPAVKFALAKPAPAAPSPASASASASAPALAPAADAPVQFPTSFTPEQRKLLATQVLLDRAHFSPGTIDARHGSNFRNAVEAWQHATGKAGDVLAALGATDTGQTLQRYTITAEDVAGPFEPTPKGFEAMSKLKTVGYGSPLEELAERFHADEAFLKSLNPVADFAKAGTVILVPLVNTDKLGTKVAKIEVDKTRDQVRAFDGGGALVAVYPATVGSTDRPAPKGTYDVRTVAPHPTYTYDPKRLTFGKKSLGKLTIAAGPNNPVGSTWIALSKPTYGIHGTPDPELVGKRASHGCVRLTNWDAAQLGAAVQKGTKVVFLGREQRKA